MLECVRRCCSVRLRWSAFGLLFHGYVQTQSLSLSMYGAFWVNGMCVSVSAAHVQLAHKSCAYASSQAHTHKKAQKMHQSMSRVVDCQALVCFPSLELHLSQKKKFRAISSVHLNCDVHGLHQRGNIIFKTYYINMICDHGHDNGLPCFRR